MKKIKNLIPLLSQRVPYNEEYMLTMSNLQTFISDVIETRLKGTSITPKEVYFSMDATEYSHELTFSTLVEESDEEFNNRLERIKVAQQLIKKNRYAEYLKLKKEFETSEFENP